MVNPTAGMTRRGAHHSYTSVIDGGFRSVRSLRSGLLLWESSREHILPLVLSFSPTRNLICCSSSIWKQPCHHIAAHLGSAFPRFKGVQTLHGSKSPSHRNWPKRPLAPSHSGVFDLNGSFVICITDLPFTSLSQKKTGWSLITTPYPHPLVQ